MNKILFTLFSFILISSCDINTHCLNKESFINGYDNFSKDVRDHYKELEKTDWNSIDKEFKSYVEQCYPKYKHELSINQKVKFWKNTIAYSIYRESQDEAYELDLDLDLENEMNEIGAQGKQEIEDFLRKDIKPELEKAVDEVLKEVESFGNKIKEWLDNQ